VKYLSPEQVLFIHSRIIEMTGGAQGVLDVGLLLSAVSRARATFEGRDLYPDIFHKTAALMESLARNHPFVDSNKRTAIASAGIFLGLNGKNLTAGQKELERFTLAVATGKTALDHAVTWFKKYAL
jgi:death on curing protein